MAFATSCLIHKEIYIIFNNFNKFWNIKTYVDKENGTLWYEPES